MNLNLNTLAKTSLYSNQYRILSGDQAGTSDEKRRDQTSRVMYRTFKGTVARDFWPLVFFMNRPHMGPLFIP